MRIIEQGRLPESQTYEVTCRHCRTRFEFARGEAKHNHDQRDGDYLSIACPLCKYECTTPVAQPPRKP